MENARQLLERLGRQLGAQEDARRTIPQPSAPGPHKRLCIGMATYDDFDGVYFTVQSMRLAHPEVLADTSFLVLDNHPEGETANALRALADKIPDVRYVPFRGFRGTAVRDLIFREAAADIVMCVDPHILVRPGALQALLEYFDAAPDSRDIVQGPLLDDSFDGIVGTHFAPDWGGGMYGRWETDERFHDERGEPFEIPMQGLGLFACRREAWPGLNPRFRGFGGEEGYLHEKFRQAGGRAICLPALAWGHRFQRPGGVPYPADWQDRVRNYHLGWAEVGWDTAEVNTHFRKHLGAQHAAAAIGRTKRQVDNAFTFFDAIFCLNADDDEDRWDEMDERFGVLDIAWRAERIPVVAGDDERRTSLLSFRSAIGTALHRGYANVLVLRDGVVFIDQTLAILADAVADLTGRPWDLLCLGGGGDGSRSSPFAGASIVLQVAEGLTRAHAVAVAGGAFERVLLEVPAEDGPEMDAFVAEHDNIDGYLDHRIADGGYRALMTFPRVASEQSLLDDEDAELAVRYVI
jgi:hypothetical protein